MEKKEDQPFIKLEKSDINGITSKLFRVPGHEDMVVRKSFIDVPDEEAENMSIHEKTEYLRNNATEFKKIVDRIGIVMAKTDYIVGADPVTGKPALFGVTERIEGENLEKMRSLDKEIVDKVDELYAKLIFDLFNSYKENNSFWCDPRNDQFIFGKTEKNETPEIYLVDVDPAVIDWNTVPMEDREHLFWDSLGLLLSQVENMEEKMGEKGFRFKKARAAIDKVKMEIFNMI